MNKAIKWFLGVIVLPVILTFITTIMEDDAKKISIWVFIVLVLLVLLYLIYDHFREMSALLSSEKITFEDVKSDLEKKAELEIIPNSLLEKNTYILNHFSQFNISRFTDRREESNRVVTLRDIKEVIYSNKDTALVLQGESGLGKSTFSRWLCSEIAKESLSHNRLRIPYMFFLYDYNVEGADIEKAIQEQLHYTKKFDPKHAKLVFILDGLNEIKGADFATLIAHIKNYCNRNSLKYSLIITSRPLSINNEIFSVIPQEVKKYFYTIQPWSEKQVKDYLQKNGVSKKETDSYSAELLKLLTTPLFAFIHVAHLKTGFQDKVKNAQQVIESYIKIWVNPEKSHSEYYDQLTRVSGQSLVKIDPKIKLDIISELGYYLTECRKINLKFSELTNLFLRHNVADADMVALIKELVNFGILIASNENKLEDENAVFRLRHQIFQEFFTAKYLLEKKMDFPINNSKDMFWKDVPRYAIIQIKSESDQVAFISYFLNKGDYLTASRLSAHIHEPNFSEVQTKLIKRIVDSLTDFDSYGYSSEVVREIGLPAESALLEIVMEINSEVVAPEELEETKDREDSQIQNMEQSWRRAGRSIHILGELRSNRLLGILGGKMPEIKSNHLIYHILEYVLKLSYSDKLKQVRSILSILRKLKHNNDPIISAYRYRAYRSLSIPDVLHRSNRYFDDLRILLQKQSTTTPSKYLRQFWVRNHGVECLSLFVTRERLEEFYGLISEIIKSEQVFAYTTNQPFYFAVHTSIFKAIINLQNRKLTKYNSEIIRQLLNCSRINDNIWALHYFNRWIDLHFSFNNVKELKTMIGEVKNESLFLSELKLKQEQLEI